MTKNKLYIVFVIFLIIKIQAQSYKEFQALSLEELLNQKITTASGIEEELINAPSSMVVVTSDEILQRGYTTLEEVLNDLPGFDVDRKSVV